MLAETFEIPIAVDLVAVGVGSLQGALFAAGFKRIDILGVAIIGIAAGIGGGFLRDILLGIAPATLSVNHYLIVSTGAAFIGMLLPRLLQKVDPVITLLDALSIGLFGAIGVTKALAMGLPFIPAIFIGTIAAVGGGVLRDVMLNIPIGLMHVGSLYAVASIVGVSSLVLLQALGVDVFIAGIVCVVMTAAVRLFSVWFGWSLPEQRALSRIRLRRNQIRVLEEAIKTGTINIDELADSGLTDIPGMPGSRDSGPESDNQDSDGDSDRRGKRKGR